MSSSVYDVLVLGGGVQGMATGWQLARRGFERLGVLDPLPVGHVHGSSHGLGRITRSAYAHPTYVRMMAVAQAEDWPELERQSGQRLVFTTGGVLFGPPDGSLETYAVSVAQAGVEMERWSPEEAAKRLPMFRFEPDDGVLWDPTAGVIAADRTWRALADLASSAGVDMLGGHGAIALEPRGDGIHVHTTDGTLRARRLVVTSGAWTGRLVSRLAPRLRVARQTVVYFRGPEADPLQVGSHPPWVWLGPGDGGGLYGLPQPGAVGLKVAWHRTEGRGDDPDDRTAGPSPSQVAAAAAWVEDRMPGRGLEVERTETCLYTLTDNEDFVLDLHPDDDRIAVGAAFSGHGFKFAPLVGRILADLVCDGGTDVAPFEADRGRFAL